MGKTLLLTGHTGFLGRHLLAHYQSLGWQVITLGRTPGPGPARHLPWLLRARPDLSALTTPIHQVIHLAGKAHVVPQNAAEERAFWEINDAATGHLLAALTDLHPRSFVLASTVAVYGRERGCRLTENTPTRPTTAYGKSKLAAERRVEEWAEAAGVPTTILRLPLVAGPGAPGNLAAITRSLRAGTYRNIRSSNVRKSMVWAGDVAALCPRLPNYGGTYHLTDGHHPTLRELTAALAAYHGLPAPGEVDRGLLKAGALTGDLLACLGLSFPLNSARLNKLTAELTFDDDRARKELNYTARPVRDHYIRAKFTTD